MATRVELRKVSVAGPNPARFDDPLSLNVALEVFEQVPQHPIDVTFTWSPIWDFPVDQELDGFEVGPFTSLGVHEFTLQSDPPNFAKIPDPTGPTALIVTLSYQGRQFLHLGYNVIVRCEDDIPDVFTSADLLTRTLERCYPRQSTIDWDGQPTGDSPSDESDGSETDAESSAGTSGKASADAESIGVDRTNSDDGAEQPAKRAKAEA